jgi:hypothetical protein
VGRDPNLRRFMNGNQQDANVICEVFILAPASLVDERESPPAGLRRGPAAPGSGPRRDRKEPILTAEGGTAKVTPSAFMRLSRYRSPRTSCSNRDVP